MTDAATLRQQRATLMIAEAQNDITQLQTAAGALADPAVDLLIQILSESAENLLDPVRKNNVANLVNVVLNTRHILAVNIDEAAKAMPTVDS